MPIIISSVATGFAHALVTRNPALSPVAASISAMIVALVMFMRRDKA